MLKAGVMEGTLFQHTTEGTPQGGILSPLLANIYLHQFDRWWWDTYGSLHPYQKAKRRQQGVGNCILTRYADDVRHITKALDSFLRKGRYRRQDLRVNG
jgi:RNA-directed DNA polymerase